MDTVELERSGQAPLVVEGEGLAALRLPPDKLLSSREPLVLPRLVEVKAFCLADGGFAVEQVLQYREAVGDASEEDVDDDDGDASDGDFIVTADVYPDVPRLTAALGFGALAQALYVVADLPVAECWDADGYPRLTRDVIMTYVWSVARVQSFMLGGADGDSMNPLEVQWWGKATRQHSPALFTSTASLRDHIYWQRQRGIDVPEHLERCCVELWRRWYEDCAARSVEAYREGVLDNLRSGKQG